MTQFNLVALYKRLLPSKDAEPFTCKRADLDAAYRPNAGETINCCDQKLILR